MISAAVMLTLSLLASGSVLAVTAPAAGEGVCGCGRIAVAARGDPSDDGPDSFQARLGTAREQVRRGQVRAAIPLLKTLKGQKAVALNAYRRSVEIDPDHREARDRLARLSGS